MLYRNDSGHDIKQNGVVFKAGETRELTREELQRLGQPPSGLVPANRPPLPPVRKPDFGKDPEGLTPEERQKIGKAQIEEATVKTSNPAGEAVATPPANGPIVVPNGMGGITVANPTRKAS